MKAYITHNIFSDSIIEVIEYKNFDEKKKIARYIENPYFCVPRKL